MQARSFSLTFFFLIANVFCGCNYEENSTPREATASASAVSPSTTLFNEIGEVPITSLTDVESWKSSPELLASFALVDKQFLSAFSNRLALEGSGLGDVRLLEFDDELSPESIAARIEGLNYLQDATISILGSTIEEDEDGVVFWETGLVSESWGEGSALFTIDGDKVVGTITTNQGVDYSLEPIRSEIKQLHVLIPRNKKPSLLYHPQGHEEIPFDIKEPSILGVRYNPSSNNQRTPIFLTIGFTRKAEQGVEAFRTQIKHYLRYSEIPFRESGINISLKLAHLERVNYIEGDSLHVDLEALKNGEGDLHRLHDLREQTYGDVLVLALFGRGGCGLAEAIRAQKENALFIFHYEDTCLRVDYVISHEAAHILGAAHNVEAGRNHWNPHYEYGHGFIDPKNGWGTLMSVPHGDCVNGECMRAPCFSSPEPCKWITDSDLVVGENVDNVKVIKENLSRIAGFY